MKIVLRNDIVEMAKPGDKCVFTGTLIVVPDVAQLGGGGAANARFKAAGGGGGRRNGGAGDAGGAGGVGGLKELGVRDLTYSLCFLAHSVRTSHSAFGSIGGASSASDSAKQLSQMQLQGGNGGGDAADSSAEETEESFSEAERDRIEEMKRQGKLYTRLVASIAPNIFGHDEIKRGILLMLFGGVHKKTADGQNLRGDINVCIVGDPSTSQS
jgi:DNA replication licensing factor MCM6